MDQSYKYGLVIEGGLGNLVTDNGFQESGWLNSATNFGNVLLTGGTTLNAVTDNLLGKLRASSFAAYGIEVRGSVSNRVEPNINYLVEPLLNADGAAGKIQRPWEDLRGNIKLNANTPASLNDTSGFFMLQGLNGKPYGTPSGDISGWVPIRVSTNAAHNTINPYINGRWRSAPTWPRDAVSVDTAGVMGIRLVDQPKMLTLSSYSTTAGYGPKIEFYRGGASTNEFFSMIDPARNGDTLLDLVSFPFTGTNVLGPGSVRIIGYLTETPGASAVGSRIDLQAVLNGTGTLRNSLSLAPSSTTDDTDLLLWDVTAGTLKRVSRGAADSGGTGFRALRVAN